MKLSRILQSQGVGTRRMCVALIETGKVSIEGRVCADPDAPIDPAGLAFNVDGEDLRYHEKAYLVLHKPAGYECSQQPMHHPGIFSLLPPALIRRGVQCVGRLDQDTTGLLLLTDDGTFIHRITSPKKNFDKVYRVTCKHPLEDNLLNALMDGVQLHDDAATVTARACQRLSSHILQLTIAEGKYHQVKRMIAAAGNRVEALHRVAIGGYALPEDLLPGSWRWLSPTDLLQLETRFHGNT